jgi:coenzyme PQQ precursor peptide PqqA
MLFFVGARWCTFCPSTVRNVAATRPFHGRACRAGKEVGMWKKPKIVEIAVGLEINSYACAELD